MDFKKLFNNLNNNGKTITLDINGLEVKIEDGMGLVGLTDKELNKLVPPETMPKEKIAIAIADAVIKQAKEMPESATMSRQNIRDLLDDASINAIKEYQVEIFSKMVAIRLEKHAQD